LTRVKRSIVNWGNYLVVKMDPYPSTIQKRTDGIKGA
jgi:hypothetical protein